MVNPKIHKKHKHREDNNSVITLVTKMFALFPFQNQLDR
jgi:hypothetical protein